jgi:hypothetical protein
MCRHDDLLMRRQRQWQAKELHARGHHIIHKCAAFGARLWTLRDGAEEVQKRWARRCGGVAGPRRRRTAGERDTAPMGEIGSGSGVGLRVASWHRHSPGELLGGLVRGEHEPLTVQRLKVSKGGEMSPRRGAS